MGPNVHKGSVKRGPRYHSFALLYTIFGACARIGGGELRVAVQEGKQITARNDSQGVPLDQRRGGQCTHRQVLGEDLSNRFFAHTTGLFGLRFDQTR